jgi:hypothetical protein
VTCGGHWRGAASPLRQIAKWISVPIINRLQRPSLLCCRLCLHIRCFSTQFFVGDGDGGAAPLPRAAAALHHRATIGPMVQWTIGPMVHDSHTVNLRVQCRNAMLAYHKPSPSRTASRVRSHAMHMLLLQPCAHLTSHVHHMPSGLEAKDKLGIHRCQQPVVHGFTSLPLKRFNG